MLSTCEQVSQQLDRDGLQAAQRYIGSKKSDPMQNSGRYQKGQYHTATE